MHRQTTHSRTGSTGIGKIYTVSQKTYPTFLAVTQESIVGFS